jgi:hypothetical protein
LSLLRLSFMPFNFYGALPPRAPPRISGQEGASGLREGLAGLLPRL